MDVDGVITVSPLPTIGNDFLGFEGLTAGDTIAVDNRSFLAFCHYARHHVSSAPEFDTYRLDGATIYPQHPAQSLSALFGGPYHDREYTGSFHGKVIVLQHTLDSTAWPSAAVGYAVLAEKELGDQLDERFRLWWIDHAEHYDASHVPPGPVPVATTRLLDTHGLVGQGLRDLIAWVEDATPPAPSTGAEYDEQGHLRLARTAGERGGIQPLVAATANGGLRAEVAPGDVVSFRVSAECPPGSGRITRLEWDFEGGGVWADLPLDTTASESLVEREVLHTFHAPGTYFCSVRATAHRDGDPETDSRLLTNLARVRVVVS
jgi:hypothetical protein